jgi:uncharacterized protein YbaR (Trm112 family)/SAM-dependent methyltransferase
MTQELLAYLVDPVDKMPLSLHDGTCDERGQIVSGRLVAKCGREYPIRNGIPRFVAAPLQQSVRSFGDQWNLFNFTDFHEHWLHHTVRNTFGTTDALRDQVIVDAGGGSGAQTLWMLQSGARHVIMLELSHSVDDVVMRNLRNSGFTNWDVIQCSIDAPPLRDHSIPGLVICHNVIQHTPSVERTAAALFALVAPGGQFVFNCYPRNDAGPIRWIRFHLVYTPVRAMLKRCPFPVRLGYAAAMGALRQVPVLGALLEKASLCVMGDVRPGTTAVETLKRRFRAAMLNTFDAYGAHEYQHHLSDDEVRTLVNHLQPQHDKVLNTNAYFARPPLIGCALRVMR